MRVAAGKLMAVLVGKRPNDPWPDCVNNGLDVAKIERIRENGFTRRTSAEHGTGDVKTLSGNLEDAATHSTAPLEPVVRRVDDDVHVQCGYVGFREHYLTSFGGRGDVMTIC